MFQGGSLWAGLASGVLSQYQDTKQLNHGVLDRSEYAVRTTENVSGAIGIMAGVEYGAVLGTTLMPGIGTAAGAVIGGLLGDKVGRFVGHHTGSALKNNRTVKNMVEPLTTATE